MPALLCTGVLLCGLASAASNDPLVLKVNELKGKVDDAKAAGIKAIETKTAETKPSLTLTRVRIPKQNESSAEHVDYFLGLLHLALDKTVESHGPYRIEMAGHLSSQARNIARISRDEGIDVIWTMTSAEREGVLQAIKFPLVKGLMGQRVFLIRAGEQSRFDGKQSLEGLQRLRAGQGSHWPDTQVLRSNQVPVITTSSYELLFPMLKSGRFDYFPRGLHEVSSELARHPELALEKNLMFKYSAPMYFFVRSENKRLASRLLEGLQRARKDGSFDHYFNTHPATRQVFKRVGSAQRRVIHLRNPLINQEQDERLEQQGRI